MLEKDKILINRELFVFNWLFSYLLLYTCILVLLFFVIILCPFLAFAEVSFKWSHFWVSYKNLKRCFFWLKHIFVFGSCSIPALKTARRQMTWTRGFRSFSRISPTSSTSTWLCKVSAIKGGRGILRIVTCQPTSHACDVFALVSIGLSCFFDRLNLGGLWFCNYRW